MAVLHALRPTPRALQRNPIVFVPVLVLLLFQLPQLVVRSVSPVLAGFVSLGVSAVLVLVMPFFMGGLLGMADEALDGRTSFETFIADGKANYVALLLAYLGLMVVNVALTTVVFFASIFASFAFYSDGGAVSLPVLGVVGVVLAAVLVAYLVLMFFIQFYGQAIVIDDLGTVNAFKHSVSVVRHHLVSALGYTVLVGIVGAVAGIVFGAASLLASPMAWTTLPVPRVSLAGVLGIGLLVVALGSVVGGFFSVYSVAFYRTITQ